MFDPKVLTNWKRHPLEGEQDVTEIQRDENGIIRENLIIKGNNLIALHTLKQQFRGQVKLIYIAPPYNTKGESTTFGYNNSLLAGFLGEIRRNTPAIRRNTVFAWGL